MNSLPASSPSYLKSRIQVLTNSNWSIVIVCFGIILRCIQFFVNQGLREDEGHLAVNFITRDLAGILKPLDHGQIAPPLFLVLEKINVMVFGQNEFAIRYLALLASCVALILAYKFLKEHTNQYITLIGITFMSINRWLIFSAVAAKPYSIDVLILLLVFYILFSQTGFSKNHKIVLVGIIGVFTLWLSFITIFILAAIGVYFLFSWTTFSKVEKLKIISIGIAWALSFCGLYFFSIAGHPNKANMMNYWGDHFMPLIPKSAEDFNWFLIHLRDSISYLLGFSAKHYILWIPYSLLFFLGILFSFKNPAYRKFLWLICIILIHLIVSGLKIYPFYSRLILYLTFPVILFVSIGLYHFIEFVQVYSPFKNLARTTSILLFFLVTIVGLIDFPYTTENLKKSLDIVKQNFVKDDKIYVYYAMDGTFKFYKEKYIPNNMNIHYGIESRTDYSKYDDELKKLSGRVWFVFAHIYTNSAGVAEDDYIFNAAKKRGKILSHSSFYQTSVFLVDLQPDK